MISLDEQAKIRSRLVERGLTLDPLLEEMIDHVCCDVDRLMQDGISFQQALEKTITEIPTEQLYTLEQATLLAIDNKMFASRWLSYLTVGTLLLALAFKVLHLQFAGQLLMFSFLLIAVSLIKAFFTFPAIRLRSGMTQAIMVVSGVIAMLVGYTFSISDLPGADLVIIIAVTVTIVGLLLSVYDAYQGLPMNPKVLTLLHEKYAGNIERFLMIMLSAVTITKFISRLTGFTFPGSDLILLIIILGAGLHFIITLIGIIERGLFLENDLALSLIALAAVCLMLPFLGKILPITIRAILIGVFMPVSAWLSRRLSENSGNLPSQFATISIPLLFVIWAMVSLNILPISFNRYVFNLSMLTLLLIALAFSRHDEATRSFLIVSLSAYLFEYTA